MKNKILIINLLLITSCQPIGPSTPSLSQIDCTGTGQWEFGNKSVGRLEDEAAPFIFGRPRDRCSFNAGEKDNIVNNTIYNATGTRHKLIAVFTMGAPGCGKSTALDEALKQIGLLRNQFIIIDPDDARAQMTAFQKATRIPSQACPTKFRAYASATDWCLDGGRKIRDALIEEALKRRKSFILDTPCTNSTYCSAKMTEAKNAGFSVYLVGVWAEKQVCVDRGLTRAFSTGRYIGQNFVETVYESIERDKQFDKLATIAHDAFIFDSNANNYTRMVFQKSRIHACPRHEPACMYFFN